MPLPEENSSPPEEVSRIIRICAPNIDRVSGLTLTSLRQTEADLFAWCDAIFIPHLVPTIFQAYSAAAAQKLQELLAADVSLDGSLVGNLNHRSRNAGQIIIADSIAPATERALSRYFSAVREGISPGHFAVLLTARAAIFHFPPQITLMTLLFLEIQAAHWSKPWNAVSPCLKRLPYAPTLLYAA